MRGGLAPRWWLVAVAAGSAALLLWVWRHGEPPAIEPAPALPAAEGTARCVVRGRVIDEVSGRPIRSFLVAACCPEPGRGLVRRTWPFRDDGGAFLLDTLPAVPAYVEASAPGYHDRRLATHQLGAGEHERLLDLASATRRTLRLALESGQTLACTEVEFEALADTPRRPSVERLLARRHWVDRSGALWVPDAPACRLLLRARAEPGGETSAIVDLERQSYVTLPAPGAPPRGWLALAFASTRTRGGAVTAWPATKAELELLLGAVGGTGPAVATPTLPPHPSLLFRSHECLRVDLWCVQDGEEVLVTTLDQGCVQLRSLDRGEDHDPRRVHVLDLPRCDLVLEVGFERSEDRRRPAPRLRRRIGAEQLATERNAAIPGWLIVVPGS